jgi:hypothetical protein
MNTDERIDRIEILLENMNESFEVGLEKILPSLRLSKDVAELKQELRELSGDIDSIKLLVYNMHALLSESEAR